MHEAELKVGRAPVGGVDARGDLDSLDRPPLERGAEDDGAHEVGVLLGELLHLRRVVLHHAVGLAPGRQRRAPGSGGRLQLRGAVGAVGGGDVGDERGRGEPGRREAGALRVGVERDGRLVWPGVVGDLDAEGLESQQVTRAGERDRFERDPLARGLRQLDAREVHGERDGGRAARAAARLDLEPLAGLDPQADLLGRAEGGGGAAASAAPGSKTARSQSPRRALPSRRTVASPPAGAAQVALAAPAASAGSSRAAQLRSTASGACRCSGVAAAAEAGARSAAIPAARPSFAPTSRF